MTFTFTHSQWQWDYNDIRVFAVEGMRVFLMPSVFLPLLSPHL
jgi:hypothetical protein